MKQGLGVQAKMLRCRAITFDVGGTLLHPYPCVGAIYADAARQAGGCAIESDELDRRFQRAWAARANFQHRKADWSLLVDEVFAGLIDPRPSTTFFEALYNRFADASCWRLYEDVLPALDRLASRGISLGIVSNWDDRLRPLLKSFRLTPFFDSIVVSCEIGFCKPSAVIFEQAARQLGCPADAILHVGDHAEEDYGGCRGAGFHGVIVDRAGALTHPPCGITPVQPPGPVIRTLQALEGVLP